MSQAVIVVNHRAGAGVEQIDALTRRLSDRLRDQGREQVRDHGRDQVRDQGLDQDQDQDQDQDVILIAIGSQGDQSNAWTQRLRAAIANGVDGVFVLGGDGTVLAVASVLINTSVPLGIIPLGTANLLARDLGIPLNAEDAADCLTEGFNSRSDGRLTDRLTGRFTDGSAHESANGSSVTEAAIDVGFVNGQPFLCASMIGLTTALARTREAVRDRGLLQAAVRLVRKALRLLWRYPYHRLRITADGQELKVTTRALMITNNPIQSIVQPYPSRARLDTGRLGLYGICYGPIWELPRLALRLLQGDWADDPRIFHQQPQSLRIEARREHWLRVMNDGERLRLKTPLIYQLRPAALRVLKPGKAAT
ncbi:diacylglycerol kinase family protein [Lamprobacter modestohalophilus]|uniref:diacylglycerol/lipid kinase family protein n=1 Tax=Lamprobacter modestohalophilus TaxID=1064514 RepID=UPI002ADEDCC5|nr:diacylglycerol kinase family protein [Lamprobacter modestohalophilus]MEA1049730.1 diacylglycerol kinase family protein [Lamprobacter modestohalophilus]